LTKKRASKLGVKKTSIIEDSGAMLLPGLSADENINFKSGLNSNEQTVVEIQPTDTAAEQCDTNR
jgi:hypothetical protein